MKLNDNVIQVSGFAKSCSFSLLKMQGIVVSLCDSQFVVMDTVFFFFKKKKKTVSIATECISALPKWFGEGGVFKYT